MAKKESATVISISSIKAACKECSLRELCLPLGLDDTAMSALEGIVRRRRTVRKGEYLYRMGEPLETLYAVRAGAIKTSELLDDGRIQVTGFQLPGEILGIDAIEHDRHQCHAEALETSEICEIPWGELEELARSIAGLQHQLLRLMSGEIGREGQLLLMIGKMSAEERLLACLLNFSQRQMRLGLSPIDIKLHMSRQDLGDYLGLALETVSRLFSRFQEEGLITVRGKYVHLNNLEVFHNRLGHGTALRQPHNSLKT